MKNFIAEGEVLAVVAGASGITSGDAVLVGDVVGVAEISATEGNVASVKLEGVYELPKVAGAIAQGKKVYYVTASGKMTGTAGSNTLAGIAYEAAADADTTVKVALYRC